MFSLVRKSECSIYQYGANEQKMVPLKLNVYVGRGERSPLITIEKK